MSFELYNIILAYGDQIKLDLNQNSPIVSKLEQFDNDWVKYNPRKNINRWGLSVTNLNGKFGSGPDLDSLYEYNKENKTNYTEFDFDEPTLAYNIVSKYCDPFKEWLFRTHFIKLKPGGFFPDHVDNIGLNIDSFRLIVPIKSLNSFEDAYFIYDSKILQWKYNQLYFLNTCKRHTVFNANQSKDSIFLVMNVKLTKESVSKVTNFVIP